MINVNRPTALAIAAIALLLGAIGPWITALGIISAGPANFTEVGIVVFGGIALIILSALTRRFMRPVSIVVGALILLEVGYVWFHLSEKDTSPLVAPGWGLFLTTAASIYLIASTWVARKQTPMEQYNIRSVTVADMPDEAYSSNAQIYPYGRCDTCGSPCDINGCTKDVFHLVAIEG